MILLTIPAVFVFRLSFRISAKSKKHGTFRKIKLYYQPVKRLCGVFADKCGKHKSQIYIYLKGRQLPGMDFFKEMKKSYPWVPLEWLISEIGAPPVSPKGDLPYQTVDAVPHMLDKPEGAVEDKDGLWGETRRHDKEGVPFDVSLFQPEDGFDPYRDAQDGLREIYKSRDTALIRAIESNIRAFRLSARLERQVTQQAREIEKLKSECDILKDRIAALEDKHKPEDPHGHGRELKRSTAT